MGEIISDSANLASAKLNLYCSFWGQIEGFGEPKRKNELGPRKRIPCMIGLRWLVFFVDGEFSHY